jgi:hypothetical protein
VPLSQEETYLLSQIQPCCHAKYIRNEYLLRVKVNYDAFTCFSALPEITMPLYIIPVEQTGQFSFMFPIPMDF